MVEIKGPEGLAVDKRGNILVADVTNNSLLVIDRSLTAVSAHEMSVSVDGGLRGAYCLCYDESRDRLYISEGQGGRVTVVDRSKDFSAAQV